MDLSLVCFVAWMLGYPVVEYTTRSKDHYKHTIEQRGFAALIQLIVWIVVGAMIWSKVK